ncbi:hypothetical protein J4232_02910 [Candidatus Woesearchaeota archaeon]|nr:hypothetical protein [Candidatus Woesearchaeota archaeon]
MITKQNLSNRRRMLLIFTVFILLIILSSFASAQGYIYMDTLKKNKIVNGITIIFQDVSTDGGSCIFKINEKTYVIEKGEIETIGKVKIWVKEIYPVRSKEQESDVCVVLVAGIDIKRESTEAVVLDDKQEIEMINKINSSSDAAADKQSSIISEIEDNQNNSNDSKITVDIIVENNEKDTEENNVDAKKGMIQRMIDFFRNLFK